MKIARITEWYRYKDKDTFKIKKIARFNNDNNQQLLIFINENNKMSWSRNVNYSRFIYQLISDKPAQISPELEKKVIEFVRSILTSTVSIADNDKI